MLQSLNPLTEAALDIARTQPPNQIQRTKAALSCFFNNGGEESESRNKSYQEVANTLDEPLKIQICPKTNKHYVTSKYNRDLNSYRSPWSNQYNPETEEGAAYPTHVLRGREEFFNIVFDNNGLLVQ